MNDMLISARHLTAHVASTGKHTLRIVNDVSLDIQRGESYAIVGKSGSGKTSLISILGLLNARYSGELMFDGKNMRSMSDRERAVVRSTRIGFVFQNYSLIPQINVWQNVALPMQYARKGSSSRRRHRALDCLRQVGLDARAADRPRTLSGGEQQRVAIARAMVCAPDLLICDEPTGALDKDTGDAVMELLMRLVRTEGRTLVMVTHDTDIAKLCQHQLRMDRGMITPC